ncbi:uridylate kinase [Anaerolineae bacterium]|nr:uridylate kinase [Anaerolineae bacterium]
MTVMSLTSNLSAVEPTIRKPRYKRVLLKLSGEALSGVGGFGIDPDQAAFIAHRVKALHTLGVQIGIVIGAGNLWRGKDGVDRGMDQTTADHMGMIGTVMNALALRDSLERENVQSRVQTAIEMNKVAEPYIRLRTIRHLEKGRVVIIGGGTGNPYFTTDTAAALRGMEIDAELLIKATKVDGIYDSDPKKNPNAHRYESITFREAIDKRLAVMDTTAFSLCMENNLPILVIDFWAEGALEAAVMGEPIGTIVSR